MKYRLASILVLISIIISLAGIINLISEPIKAEVFGINVRVDDDIGPENQWYPSVAIDNNGDIHVVWEDLRNGNQDIYYAKSTNGGIFFDANIRVDDTGIATNSQRNPSIAVNLSGEIYIVWQDMRNGNNDIYFAKSTNGGVSFDTNVRVDDTGVGISGQIYPAIAVDNNGIIYVVWQDMRNGDWDIYFSKSMDGGLSFDPNVRVDDSAIVGTSQAIPSIALDSTGNIFVVFEDNRNGNYDIFFARSMDGGSSFDSNVRVDDSGASTSWQNYPSIGVDDAGNIYSAWTDDRNGNMDIYFAKSISGGLSFSANVRVDDTGASSLIQNIPTIAVNGSGNVFVTWGDKRNGNFDIYFANSTNGGLSFNTNIRVDDTGTDTSDQDFPNIAIDNNNNISIVWQDGRDGDLNIYFSKGIIPNVIPTCVIVAPSQDEIISGTISITGNASDSDGTVQFVEVKIDSGSWNVATGTTSWTYSLDTIALSDGDHTIYARSYDGENYSTTTSRAVKVNNINEAPTLAVTSPSEGDSVSGIITISGTASDPDDDSELTEIELKINTDSWVSVQGTTSWSYELNTTTLSNGQHTLYFRAFDGSEYSSELQINITINNLISDDGDKSFIEEYWWIIVIIMVIIIIIAVLVLMTRKKGKPEEIPEMKAENELNE